MKGKIGMKEQLGALRFSMFPVLLLTSPIFTFLKGQDVYLAADVYAFGLQLLSKVS